MAGRDSKGKFVKGNKAAKGKEKPIELRNIRHETKEEIYRCAHSLSKPWSTLKEDLARKDATRLELLTAKAVSGRNYKFVAWLLEMVAGKPKFDIDADLDGGKKEIILKYSLKKDSD